MVELSRCAAGKVGRFGLHWCIGKVVGDFVFTRRHPRPPMHNNTTYPSITKFQAFVDLKDFRPPTKKEYVRYVRKCAEHFGRDPLSLTEDQLRAYFLFLRQEKRYSRSPMKAAKFSLRSFFVDCHNVSGWTVFSEVRIAEPLILPLVLSRQEVAKVLQAVREPRLAVCLEL